MSEPTQEVVEPVADPAQEPAETDWKAEARKWEKRAKDNSAELEAAKPKVTEYDRLVEASKTDLERKAEEVTRWQAEAERWRTTSVANRIEALAGQSFVSTADATKSLTDHTRYIDAGGVVNDAAIQSDLEAVLAANPHYRRQETPNSPRAPFPNPAQGVGGTHTPNPVAEFTAILQGLDR